MLFKPELIEKILGYEKTQTRRIALLGDEYKVLEIDYRTKEISYAWVKRNGRMKWRVGQTYALQLGRGKPRIGRRIEIISIRKQFLQGITEADAIAEGFASIAEFAAYWDKINGKKKGYAWADNPTVWVLEFELIPTGDYRDARGCLEWDGEPAEKTIRRLRGYKEDEL